MTLSLQKMEAGALGDWLLGTAPVTSAPIDYQSSKKPEDWLVSQKESQVRQTRSEDVSSDTFIKMIRTHSDFLFLFQTSCPVLTSVDFLQAWGQLRDLEAWLLQDHTPVSRERTTSSCSSSFSIEKIDESEFIVSPEEEEEEEEELSDWLITPTTAAMETMSDAERWRQVLKPFADSWSSSEWLAGSSRPAADCSSCCQTTKAMEIENLGQLKCLKTPPPSGPASPTIAPPAALEAWLQQVVPLQQTCKANEVCSTYSDCVCDENCGKEALSLWLLRQDGRDKNGVPVAKNTPPTITNAPPPAKNTPPNTKNAPPTLHHREQEQKVSCPPDVFSHVTNKHFRLNRVCIYY